MLRNNSKLIVIFKIDDEFSYDICDGKYRGFINGFTHVTQNYLEFHVTSLEPVIGNMSTVDKIEFAQIIQNCLNRNCFWLHPEDTYVIC